LTVARLVQGLSVGGEYGAATTFLTESAPHDRRGFYGSFLFVSISLGLLLASGTAWLLTQLLDREALEQYGWRIPFFIGGCASLIGLWMRRGVEETQVFQRMKAKGRTSRRSLLWVWRHHRRAVLLLMGTSILPAFSFYLFVSYIPVYAIHRAGADASVAFKASTIAIALFMFAQPAFGALSDRLGRKPQLILYACAYLLFLYPVVTSIGSGLWSILLVECFGLLAYGLYSAIAPTLMAELFDSEVRGIGIGAFYNLVVALLGGTTPYIMTWLQAMHREGWFLLYVCFGAFITLVTFCRMPETRGASIE
jgi:MHS family alpha-ketoglutarate permease-like MFS transporter